MRPAEPLQLTDRQAEILTEIRKYYEVTGEGCSAGYLSRRFHLTREGIRSHLAALSRKGWLASSSLPARPRKTDPSR